MRKPLLIIAALCLVGAVGACADKDREVPVTELPAKPESAALPCETATDQEIIECLKNPNAHDLCRKLDITCARYQDLQKFVDDTWKKRDKT